MYAALKLLRRTSCRGLAPSVAHLEQSAWIGFNRFFTVRSSGDSSDEERSTLKIGTPEPSGPVRDADLEARDAKAQAEAMGLLRAALDEASEEEEDFAVSEEDQRSLRVGVVGSPNAGKSTLTNHLVGSKVSAVSRKTNTTHKEHMGILTKGDSQLECFGRFSLIHQV